MGKLFDDTMQGLLEAVSIDRGGVILTQVEGMPATTFRAEDREKELIDTVITIRKEQNLSQERLAELTGNKQQAISRTEKKEHSPSLKQFCNIVHALGYDIQIVKHQTK